MSRSLSPVVWITGAANGVGAQLVTTALLRGFRIVATDINIEGLKARAQESSWPSELVLIQALDVRSSEQWRQVREALDNRWGQWDVLINNAGILRPGFLREASEEDLTLHLDVNLKGVILGSQLACWYMGSQGRGHIINIASLAGMVPVSGLGYYSVSKFGVRAYSLILAEEMAPQGVKVSVLCPDLIKTAMYDLQLDYPEEAALTFSGGRALSVEEIATCVFDRILTKAPLEVAMPYYRGWLAKMGNLLPLLSHWLGARLRLKGRARLLAERRQG